QDEKLKDEKSITDEVKYKSYYHGLIGKKGADEFLKKEGDFIIRKTEHTSGVIVLVICVKAEDKVRNLHHQY
ncbi:hypothetical protein PENTCL1PPCAC_11831, partial [Pristionchus entomophagus]